MGVSDSILIRSPVDARETSATASVGDIHVNVSVPGGAPAPAVAAFCVVCGFRIDDPELRCPRCREFVHVGCYRPDERMCERCFGERLPPNTAPTAVPIAQPEPQSAPSLPAEITDHGIELVLVPAGPFMMGSEHGAEDEQPIHEVYLDAYYIGKHPVTNRQYREFVSGTGHAEPPHWDPAHRDHDGFAGDDKPVVYVSWDDASAFCRWLSRATGQDWHLPTEAEWEKAARGTDGRTYPWGNEEPTSRRCNFAVAKPEPPAVGGFRPVVVRRSHPTVGHTTEVGSYPAGVSPFGCHDMAGNVWEWCAGGGPRGGSWSSAADECRSTYRRPKSYVVTEEMRRLNPLLPVGALIHAVIVIGTTTGFRVARATPMIGPPEPDTFVPFSRGITKRL